jgi:hypothetical protein
MVPFDESQINQYPSGREKNEDSDDEKNDESFA